VNTFINPEYTSNVVSTTHDVDQFDRVISCSNTDFTGTVNDGWYSGATPFYPERTIEFQTVFVPLNALANTSFRMGYTQKYCSFADPADFLFETTQGVDMDFYDVEVVFMVEMGFETLNDKGEKNSNFQIFTYQVPSWEFFAGGFGSTPNFDMRPENENLVFRNTNFDGSNVTGCVKNGLNYTCKAWNDILIEGNINISNGYFVDFVAGNEIVNRLNSSFPIESVLRIELVLSFNNPVYPVDLEFVKTFCGKEGQPSNYLANVAGKQGIILSDSIDYVEIELEREFEFVVFPNPAQRMTRIKISNLTERATVKVFDFTGREINVNLKEENELYSFDSSILSSGVYTINVIHLGITKTKKLIVN
jgi:hypothetical protein